jgi:hypothetical protein
MKALSEKITESIESLRRIAPSSSAEVARVLLDSADALQELHFLYKSTSQLCDDWETEARNARRQRDEARFEVERLKTELAQAISERTPHDYGLLASQRDDYRERLGAACKEIFELEAELLTKQLMSPYCPKCGGVNDFHVNLYCRKIQALMKDVARLKQQLAEAKKEVTK